MSQRPKIKVPMENLDYVIELLSITLLVLSWVYAIISFSELPEEIASHFNALGKPDGFSNRAVIFSMPLIATVLYVFMLVLTKYPHKHNYMVNITQENALKNYRFSIRVLRIVNFLCVLLMVYIGYHMIESGKGNSLTLGRMFLPLIIGISVVLPIGILAYQQKLNKS